MYLKETGPPPIIKFYYYTGSLFDDISLRTLYRAKNIRDAQGEALIDDLAITNDEKDAFNTFLKTAIYEIYEVVIKMTSGVTTDPLFINVPQILGTNSNQFISGFRILDHEAYNNNVLLIVDNSIFQFIRYSILAEWYELVGQSDDAVLWETKKKIIKMELITKKLFQLRKPLIM